MTFEFSTSSLNGVFAANFFSGVIADRVVYRMEKRNRGSRTSAPMMIDRPVIIPIKVYNHLSLLSTAHCLVINRHPLKYITPALHTAHLASSLNWLRICPRMASSKLRNVSLTTEDTKKIPQRHNSVSLQPTMVEPWSVIPRCREIL